ncbi:OTU domain-containing protein 3 [Blyttiomyces sp. JEL0837]|nr:OTU domain-containing protein 3 [Blyttiomyces sp. JEL0837]
MGRNQNNNINKGGGGKKGGSGGGAGANAGKKGGNNSKKKNDVENDAATTTNEGGNKKQGRRQKVTKYDGWEDEGNRTLNEQLRALGLKLKDMTGDGRFAQTTFNASHIEYLHQRSLSDQLEGTPSHHPQIRQKVCKHMQENPDLYQPFMIDESLDQHISRMKKEGTYGGNEEVVAFARAYNIDIAIHQAGSPVWIVRGLDSDWDGGGGSNGEQQQQQRKLIHIVYHSWEHYSSVRNIDDNGGSGPPVIRIRPTGDYDASVGSGGSSSGGGSKDPDAPPSAMERMIMDSVGTDDLVRVRTLLSECRGDPGRVMGILFDERESGEMEEEAAEVEVEVEVQESGEKDVKRVNGVEKGGGNHKAEMDDKTSVDVNGESESSREATIITASANEGNTVVEEVVGSDSSVVVVGEKKDDTNFENNHVSKIKSGVSDEAVGGVDENDDDYDDEDNDDDDGNGNENGDDTKLKSAPKSKPGTVSSTPPKSKQTRGNGNVNPQDAGKPKKMTGREKKDAKRKKKMEMRAAGKKGGGGGSEKESNTSAGASGAGGSDGLGIESMISNLKATFI